MFEAADPPVFEWYIKNCGAEVNLFVDHSQIVQLECLRAGLWGTKSSWGVSRLTSREARLRDRRNGCLSFSSEARPETRNYAFDVA